MYIYIYIAQFNAQNLPYYILVLTKLPFFSVKSRCLFTVQIMCREIHNGARTPKTVIRRETTKIKCMLIHEGTQSHSFSFYACCFLFPFYGST